MSIPSAIPELSIAALYALSVAVRERVPRRDAVHEIEITPAPMRTCYETMMRLVGPRDAVLDYAAFLFAEESGRAPKAVSPLTTEEARVDTEHGILTLVLSRGAFVAA